jgi:hypothetical protein
MRGQRSRAVRILLIVTAIPLIAINLGAAALLGLMIYNAFAYNTIVGLFLVITLLLLFAFAGYIYVQFRKRLAVRSPKVPPPTS